MLAGVEVGALRDRAGGHSSLLQGVHECGGILGDGPFGDGCIEWVLVALAAKRVWYSGADAQSGLPMALRKRCHWVVVGD